MKSMINMTRKVRAGMVIKETAAYTVEAALVMAVTLFLIASLLSASFEVHGEVVGSMVMQQSLEQAGYMEEGQMISEIEEEGNRDLSTYFRCSDRGFQLSQQGRRIEAAAFGSSGSRISIKRFEPERFLRLLRAVGI